MEAPKTTAANPDDALAELDGYERNRDALKQRLLDERERLKKRLQALEAGLAKLGVSVRKKRDDAGRPRPPKDAAK